MNLLDTLRIAFRESDGGFLISWVEDTREVPKGRFSDIYPENPYIVQTGFGRKGEGGVISIFQSCPDLEMATSMADSVVDSLVVNGDKSSDPNDHGYKDVTEKGLEFLGVGGRIFPIVWWK